MIIAAYVSVVYMVLTAASESWTCFRLPLHDGKYVTERLGDESMKQGLFRFFLRVLEIPAITFTLIHSQLHPAVKGITVVVLYGLSTVYFIVDCDKRQADAATEYSAWARLALIIGKAIEVLLAVILFFG